MRYLWIYAIGKTDTNYIHAIFDIIAIFGKNHTKNNENLDNIPSEEMRTGNNHKNILNTKLKEIYGFERMYSNNIFETYDHFNFSTSSDDFECGLTKKFLLEQKKEKMINYDNVSNFSIIPISQRDPEFYNLIRSLHPIKSP